jgi:hypothetical protein
VEALIGLLYSSSLQLRSVLSTRASAFEHDLRERLVGLAPAGRLVEEIEFTVVSARK